MTPFLHDAACFAMGAIFGGSMLVAAILWARPPSAPVDPKAAYRPGPGNRGSTIPYAAPR